MDVFIQFTRYNKYKEKIYLNIDLKTLNIIAINKRFDLRLVHNIRQEICFWSLYNSFQLLFVFVLDKNSKACS